MCSLNEPAGCLGGGAEGFVPRGGVVSSILQRLFVVPTLLEGMPAEEPREDGFPNHHQRY